MEKYYYNQAVLNKPGREGEVFMSENLGAVNPPKFSHDVKGYQQKVLVFTENFKPGKMFTSENLGG